MGLLFALLSSGGFGYWVGRQGLLPNWAVIALLVIGTGLWVIAEWLERKGCDCHGDEGDRP
jgi:hypothetical protein